MAPARLDLDFEDTGRSRGKTGHGFCVDEHL